jgi:hypothetical protein
LLAVRCGCCAVVRVAVCAGGGWGRDLGGMRASGGYGQDCLDGKPPCELSEWVDETLAPAEVRVP